MSARDEQRLKDIYLGVDAEKVNFIGDLIKDRLNQTVERFYIELLEVESARFFLDSALVKERLHGSLTEWLQMLFSHKDDDTLEQMFAFQKNIGNVHARINIPMHLVVEGMRILRREIICFLSESDIPRQRLVDLVVLVGEVLDHNLSLINESYVRMSASYERNNQALRLQLSPSAQALECERLRGTLRGWSNQLWRVLGGRGIETELPSLGRAEFGLWMFHKAPLVLPQYEQLHTIQQNIQAMDALLGRQRLSQEHLNAVSRDTLSAVDDQLNSIELALDMMIEAILAQESGRDPLTKVYNRRFLDSVVKHEMEVSMRHEIRFGFLLCDIDHFKTINDTYGHDAGDAVLQQFAERLSSAARVNDYVFRFGGEEFLFVYGDMSPQRLEHLAEKVRHCIEQELFDLPSGEKIHITASFGGAVHDGNPNFHKTLKLTDEALYEAKHSGRNRCIIRA
ncbi:diguanylate cyclase [Magnetococcus marinus MC-1]|uniref:Diguanylate cyclase DosC n=1 Tax=Magnetococcus marinus (strain ATCC BAA-1437 / JCM 17883 / MC-1) TaxID=156889 RepID=A0L865_MAGMM|nr:GGDEF domain-containing protein [Magnetococcus marinus]ABK44158.1 diguanylate cyclase [Magnetococcus marinus MC-1]